MVQVGLGWVVVTFLSADKGKDMHHALAQECRSQILGAAQQ